MTDEATQPNEPVAWAPKGHLARYLVKGQACWVYPSPPADDAEPLYAHPAPAPEASELNTSAKRVQKSAENEHVAPQAGVGDAFEIDALRGLLREAKPYVTGGKTPSAMREDSHLRSRIETALSASPAPKDRDPVAEGVSELLYLASSVQTRLMLDGDREAGRVVADLCNVIAFRSPSLASAEGAGVDRESIAREVYTGWTGNRQAWDRAKLLDASKYAWETADAIIALFAPPSTTEKETGQ